MTSQLNVDTIVDKAGTSGPSLPNTTTIKIGNTSTYVSEGGAVIQNTVQGIAKMWTRADHTGTAEINDSFNTASITDDSTGFLTYISTNNMTDTLYTVSLCYQPVATNVGTDHFNAYSLQTTSANQSRHHEDGGLEDCDHLSNMRHGDLA